MKSLQEKYDELCATRSDINEHLPTLKQFAEKCEHITEMGVRGVVSTYAFLMGGPKKLIGYDIGEYKGAVDECRQIARAAGLDWEFKLADVLKVEIEETDFLFIDTFHSMLQLQKELSLHAKKVRKYIGFHDTTTFWENSEPSYESASANKVNCKEGLKYAIEPFLAYNPEWRVVYRTEKNNGLMIIERCK